MPSEPRLALQMAAKTFQASFVATTLSLLAALAPLSKPCYAQEKDVEHSEPTADAERFFAKHISPFIKTYCLECHSNKRPTEAGVNFSPSLKAPGHAAFTEQWKNAVARVKAHDMPPDYVDQPSTQEREAFVKWLTKVKYLSPKDPGHFIIRRLTKTEYANTLRDLFGVDNSVADELPDEVSGAGYLNSLSPLQLEQYVAIADKVIDQVLERDDALRTSDEHEPLGLVAIREMELGLRDRPAESMADARVAAENLARRLARSAYRRPPTREEVEVLLRVFDLGSHQNRTVRDSMRLMIKAVLVSPQFLFITPAVEADVDDAIVPLDDYQLASRLSYFLWATMPDAELMTLAENGKLHERPVLEAQVTRMLADARSRALFDGFGTQWLGLGKLQTIAFDQRKFPQMTNELRAAMVDEARLFFESIVRENHSVLRFVESDFTFVNGPLATIYGLEESVAGDEFQRVQLADANRGGILGMPAVLAATSFPNRTSPVIRGVWVLEQVLGDHVPPAPPDVPALENQDPKSVAELTLRQRTELHRTNPTCANCHRLLDPIGFGLENFDAIGRWREKDDNGEIIDASGQLPDGEHFSSPQELKSMIAGQIEKLARNLVEKLLAYALCRGLDGYDEIVVDELMRDVAQDGYRMQSIVCAVVTSYPFTHRRIQEDEVSHE